MVTIQKRASATVYVADVPAVLNTQIAWKIAPISSEQAAGYSLSWTGDGKLLQVDVAGHAYASAVDESNLGSLVAKQ